jgi:hypothetical protein
MALALMPLLEAGRNYGYPYSHLMRRFDVTAYGIAEAKNRLPSLIDMFEACNSGERVLALRDRRMICIRMHICRSIWQHPRD